MKFFIYRPILSSVISIITALCGLIALFNLPVSQFPNLSPPSISIRTSFPGANAETAARVVGAQIEGMLNGIPNLLYTHLYIKPGSNRIKTINFVASPRITI